jgi:hypothetical protein
MPADPRPVLHVRMRISARAGANPKYTWTISGPCVPITLQMLDGPHSAGSRRGPQAERSRPAHAQAAATRGREFVPGRAQPSDELGP